jgi:hypothetical protein
VNAVPAGKHGDKQADIDGALESGAVTPIIPLLALNSLEC